MKRKEFNRYHSDVFFPENFADLVLEFIDTLENEPTPTNHCWTELLDDKRGMIPLPATEELLDPSNKIIEFYERKDKLGRIQKAIFRIGHMNENYDYTYVVARGNIIVTAWANDKGDNHRLTNSLNEYIQNSKDERLIEGENV